VGTIRNSYSTNAVNGTAGAGGAVYGSDQPAL
jgi:hypothetical protein